jgi:hypothetical protein
MTDAQRVVSLLHVGKALHAALLEGFLVRKSPVRVLVDQDVDQYQTLRADFTSGPRSRTAKRFR